MVVIGIGVALDCTRVHFLMYWSGYQYAVWTCLLRQSMFFHAWIGVALKVFLECMFALLVAWSPSCWGISSKLCSGVSKTCTAWSRWPFCWKPLGLPWVHTPGSSALRAVPKHALSGEVHTWLILPVVICLSQRLSHACLSISFYTVKLRMAH